MYWALSNYRHKVVYFFWACKLRAFLPQYYSIVLTCSSRLSPAAPTKITRLDVRLGARSREIHADVHFIYHC
jgi:hypothetical protein